MKTWMKLTIGLIAVTLLTPLGILAKGTAWGEWSAEELRRVLGFAPLGLQRLENIWHAQLSGYAVPGWQTSRGSAMGYLISAVAGVGLISLITWIVGRCLASDGGRDRRSFVEKTLAGIEGFFHVFQTAESFALRPGWLQTLDPRLKLLTFLATIVSITLAHHIRPLLFLYSIALLLVLMSRLPLVSFLLRTWIFIPLFTLVMTCPVLLNVVTPGPTLLHLSSGGSWGNWHIPAIAITRPGLSIVSLLVLRVATAVSWSLLLLWTTRWQRLLASLQVLHVPQAMVFALAMTVRYLVLLVRQVEETHFAIKSRAMYSLSAKQGRQAVAGAIVTTLRKSIQSSEDTFSAMVSRGFTGQIVQLDHPVLGQRDYLWAAAWFVSMLCIWHRGL